LTKHKQRALIPVGQVIDEAGEFYILREVGCEHIREDNKHVAFTGVDIVIPGKYVIYGDFIVNRTTYFYAKAKQIVKKKSMEALI
jgi:hypothetical protein